jgi:hypothetical protein
MFLFLFWRYVPCATTGGQLALWVSSELVAPRLNFRPALCVGVAPAGNLFDAYKNK